MLRLDVIDEHAVEVIDDSDLLAVGRNIDDTDGSGLLDDGNREAIVDEDLEHASVLEANEDSLSLRRSTDCLHISDVRVEHPLAFKGPVERQKLDFLLENEHEMLRDHEKQVAINLLIDLLIRLVLHVVRVLARHTVYDDLFGELDGETVLVDGYLLDIIAAPDLDSGLSHQVLNDHVGHQLSIGITVLIKAVDSHEFDVVHRDQSIVSACEHIFRYWVDCRCPYPLVELGYSTQKHAIFVPQGQFLVTATDCHVLTGRVKRYRAWIKSKVLITSELFVVFPTRQLID